MLKVELHTHTADDPRDRIPYTTGQLIDRAADLGYDALAITLHDKQLDVRPWASQAADRGVVLIPGIERTIQGKHVLLLNFAQGTEDIQDFQGLSRLKRNRPGLVIAPHPFFPAPTCLRGLMDTHADLFDAVEYNGMFTPGLDFNRAAVRWAAAHGKPVVGNGDVHRLQQLGPTYSLVEADRDADAICAAVAAGRVQVRSAPHSWFGAGQIMADLALSVVAPGLWPRVPTSSELRVPAGTPVGGRR